MTEAEKVAASLTSYERNAMTGRIVHITKRDGLVEKGLLSSDGGRNWTRLGLAVRVHLLKVNPDNGEYGGKEMVPEVRYIHDGEWVQVSCGNGRSIAVYPREDGTFSIGRPDVPGCWRDLDRQTGFANMQAAIDQAVWLAEEPEMLRQVWS